MDFVLSEWLDYAKRVANSFGRSYPTVDADDINQELAIWVITQNHHFKREDIGPSYIKKCLSNVATNYCQRERSRKYFSTDEYHYRPDDVRSLLEQYFSGPAEHVKLPQDAQSVRGDDALAVMADISRALDLVSQQYQDALYAHYGPADELGTPAERQTLSRAVRKLTGVLNGQRRQTVIEHQGPGSRRVLTNTAAQYLTRMAVSA